MPCTQAPTNVTMGVVKVAGDGDCLFHALAFFDGSDGGALRIDVADFMEAEAVNLNGWTGGEAPENKWGGHTAMMATRVGLHTRLEDGGIEPQLRGEQLRGATSSFSLQQRRPLRCFEWGGGRKWHGSCLAAATPASTMWRRKRLRQSSPLSDSRAETQAPKPKRQRFSAARPQKISKKKPLNLKKAFNGGQCCGGEEEAECAQEHQKQWRYTQKTTPPPELRDDIPTEMCRIRVAPMSEHPHRQQEDLIKDDIRIGLWTRKGKRNWYSRGSSSVDMNLMVCSRNALVGSVWTRTTQCWRSMKPFIYTMTLLQPFFFSCPYSCNNNLVILFCFHSICSMFVCCCPCPLHARSWLQPSCGSAQPCHPMRHGDCRRWRALASVFCAFRGCGWH